MNPYGWLDGALATLHRASWHRRVYPIAGTSGPLIEIEGRSLLNFASNDYLGLAGDARLAAAAVTATQRYGTGSTGSRLLSGQRPPHTALERDLAAFKHADGALVFSSGYLANLGAITALVGQRDLVLADQYNHASLKAGASLSGAQVIDYAHCDLAELKGHLQRQRASYRRCLVVTDGVFSMDGDLCPLPQVLDLADRFEAMVLVDDAHGTGVLGQTGRGLVEHWGCGDRPLVQVGTLSKALGSQGGFVAGSKSLIEFLQSRAASWIYTTGLAPADAAAACCAVGILQQEPARVERLQLNATYLRQRLDQMLGTVEGNRVKRLASESPIVCLQVESATAVLALGQRLRELGVFVSAVRPPTVSTSRLRLTVMATHTPAQLDQLVSALRYSLQG